MKQDRLPPWRGQAPRGAGCCFRFRTRMEWRTSAGNAGSASCPICDCQGGPVGDWGGKGCVANSGSDVPVFSSDSREPELLMGLNEEPLLQRYCLDWPLMFHSSPGMGSVTSTLPGAGHEAMGPPVLQAVLTRPRWAGPTPRDGQELSPRPEVPWEQGGPKRMCWACFQVWPDRQT